MSILVPDVSDVGLKRIAKEHDHIISEEYLFALLRQIRDAAKAEERAEIAAMVQIKYQRFTHYPRIVKDIRERGNVDQER